MTALYSISENGGERSSVHDASNRLQSTASDSDDVNYMCNIILSHSSKRPIKQLGFTWMAPPRGYGCVTFIATAVVGDKVLFKDRYITELCEAGASVSPRPVLSGLYQTGVILREDFESLESSRNIWSKTSGLEFSKICGHIATGKSAVFCQSSVRRELVTTVLNTTSAASLQFTLGTGICAKPFNDSDILVEYSADSSCSSWNTLKQIRSDFKTSDCP
ncbi:reelin-like [Tubulanus polymorphus]|uniref:reelin-like n=1 Tax=Tubulanus polymorphus TaxID=672921 RepID=UPI003DA22103